MRNNYVIYNHKSFLGYCLCASTKTTWTNGIYYPIESKSKMILIEGSLVVASYSCSSPPVDWFNMLLLLCQITSKMIVMVTGSRFTSLHCSLSVLLYYPTSESGSFSWSLCATYYSACTVLSHLTLLWAPHWAPKFVMLPCCLMLSLSYFLALSHAFLCHASLLFLRLSQICCWPYYLLLYHVMHGSHLKSRPRHQDS